MLALAPKPELVERMQNVAFVAGRFTTPEGALDLAIHQVVSRSITKALEAASIPYVQLSCDKIREQVPPHGVRIPRADRSRPSSLRDRQGL